MSLILKSIQGVASLVRLLNVDLLYDLALSVNGGSKIEVYCLYNFILVFPQLIFVLLFSEVRFLVVLVGVNGEFWFDDPIYFYLLILYSQFWHIWCREI